MRSDVVIHAPSRGESREPGAPVGAGQIPLCVPTMAGNELAYLTECVETNFVSSVGPFVDRFERELAGRTGVAFGVATATGTAALHLSLLAAGVRADDDVLTSALTFIAPANAIRYVGAWPIFVDAERDYWQMDPLCLEEFLSRHGERRGDGVWNRMTGRRIGAILPVHILGHPVDIDAIVAIARRYRIAVVEDVTETLGATYKRRPVGSDGVAACYSFNGNKLLTCGGGGMITTNDAALASRAKYLSTQAKDDPIEFVHGEVGFNYRLTNIQAAVGCAQAEHLDRFVDAKRRIADRYSCAFKDQPGLTPMPRAPWAQPVYWMYTITVDESEFGLNSRTLQQRLDAAGIQTRPLWQPLHRSPAHAASPRMECPVADELYRIALSLPCSVSLSADDQDRVIDAILGAPRSGR